MEKEYYKDVLIDMKQDLVNLKKAIVNIVNEPLKDISTRIFGTFGLLDKVNDVEEALIIIEKGIEKNEI